MICNEQKKIVTKCGEKDAFDTSQTIYKGKEMPIINIKNGDDLTTILLHIEKAIADAIDGNFRLVNIGEGKRLGAGKDATGAEQLRTIVKGDGIEVVQNEKDVTISLSVDYFNNEFVIGIKNIGNGFNIYKGKNADKYEFHKVDNGDGVSISLEQDTIVFSLDKDWLDENYVYTFSNKGSGFQLLEQIEKQVSVKTIKAKSNKVKIESDVNEGLLIDIDTNIVSSDIDLDNVGGREPILKKVEDKYRFKTLEDSEDIDIESREDTIVFVIKDEFVQNKVPKTFTDKFVGVSTLVTSRDIDKILHISYEGSIVPETAYTKTSMRQIDLDVSVFNILLEEDDIIYVTYISK